MQITLNGESREVDLVPLASLDALISVLDLKADQVAVEQNGLIVRRSAWSATQVQQGDRFEVVQFVGGGCPVNSASSRSQRRP